MTTSEKYILVDSWMMLKRAEEEIQLLKEEMKNHISYLTSTRSMLAENVAMLDSSTHDREFSIGKSVLSRAEISRLDVQIRECLITFKLYSEDQFKLFTNTEQFAEQFDDSESDSVSDFSDYEESTESEEQVESYEESENETSESDSM